MSGPRRYDDHLPLPRPAAATPAGSFTIRPLDPVADLPAVHTWMNDPVVARFWELDGPQSRLVAHLDTLFAGGHSRPYVGLLDGEPMSYWELYWAEQDPLARHYAARPGDAGLHLLLGAPRHRGRGLGAVLIRAVSDWQLAHPRADRVVAEPDVGNTASVRSFERAGFADTGRLALPDKTAALMVRDPRAATEGPGGSRTARAVARAATGRGTPHVPRPTDDHTAPTPGGAA